MTHSLIECHKILAAGRQSPFSKLIALGYYDGPTDGVLQCDVCSTAYRFKMIDWDEDQDIRIFSLSQLPAEAFTKIAMVCERTGTPIWPQWTPIWKFSCEAEKHQAEQEIDRILSKAVNPQFIVAARDLTAQILGSMKWDKMEMKDNAEELFARLGIA